MAEIAFVLGTRAELIKSFPVIKRLKEVDVIATGQHNLDYYADLFGIDIKYITEPPKKSSRFMGKTIEAVKWIALLIPKIAGEIKECKIVLYHGDTISTAAAAIASKIRKKKGMHLEAGLRSFSIFEPFPEEISRKIADHVSEVLFAVSETAEQNLRSEKVKGEIYRVGNTIVDSALEAKKMFKGKINAPKEFALATVHRHENIKSKERMKKIVSILENVPLPLLFFVHDNTKKMLQKYGLLGRIKRNENIEIRSLLPYHEFVNYVERAKILLTDGGSIQEESLIFKKPCFLLRMRTERVEGLKTGINFLTKLNVKWTISKVHEVLSKEWKIPEFENPYGKKGVSDKIAEIITEKSLR